MTCSAATTLLSPGRRPFVGAGGRGGRVAAAPVALPIALLLFSACEQTGATAQPVRSPTLSGGITQPVQLPAQSVVVVGAHEVAALGCGAQVIAWPTDSQPIANQTVPRRDVVEVVSQSGGQPRVVARAQHGGDLDSPVPITDPWLVYIEYKQHLTTSSAEFWYLNAVNLGTGETRVLASAVSGAELNAVPRYSASSGRAVWDQYDAHGVPVLRLHDFATGQTTTLGLPPGAFPVNPVISGNEVIYVDNSTDPNSSQEDWLGRRGSLRRYNIQDGQVVTLDPEPSAFMAQIGGSQVVWYAVPQEVKTVPIGGGSITIIGRYSGIPQTNGSVVVWYDSRALRFMAFGLNNHRMSPLQIGDWPDPRGTFALCGNRLYFALSPDLESPNITIRYADLAGL